MYYNETSEESKAVERLNEIRHDFSLSDKDLHYANILFNLIKNLTYENEKLKEKNEELKQVSRCYDKAYNLGKAFKNKELKRELQVLLNQAKRNANNYFEYDLMNLLLIETGKIQVLEIILGSDLIG